MFVHSALASHWWSQELDLGGQMRGAPACGTVLPSAGQAVDRGRQGNQGLGWESLDLRSWPGDRGQVERQLLKRQLPTRRPQKQGR